MRTAEEFASVTQMLETLIARESDQIALYERAAKQVGDSLVKPLLLSIAQEKRAHRALLEQDREELNEQFSLDEAIV